MDALFEDYKLERYADLLFWSMELARGQKFRKSDVVLVDFDPPALPLAEAVYSRLHDLGMNPVARQRLTARMEHDFYTKANNKRLMFLPPGEEAFYEGLNGQIRIIAPESLTHLARIDPEAPGRVRRSRSRLMEIMARRSLSGELGRTVCLYPTEELASRAGMSLSEYAEQVSRACWLGSDSPVREWKRFRRDAESLAEWLGAMRVREYHVESASIDLRITPGKKRKWLSVTGRNVPSYEFYLSPNWRGTEGVFLADVPSWRQGHLVSGARLEFVRGEVVSAGAEEGGQFLREQLAMDQGANKVGEFSLTDRRFSRIDRFMAHALYDENIGGLHGNCHIAMGSAYTESYAGDTARLSDDLRDLLGLNRSDLHWDLVNTEDKRVTALLEGGEVTTVYENGEFKY